MPGEKRRKTSAGKTVVAKKKEVKNKMRTTKKLIKKTMLNISETKFTSYNFLLGALSQNSGTSDQLVDQQRIVPVPYGRQHGEQP